MMEAHKQIKMQILQQFGLQHKVALKMVEKSIKYDGNSTPDLKKHEVQQ